MQTLYNYLAFPPDGKLSNEYLIRIHEFDLFRPILEIKDTPCAEGEEKTGLNEISKYKFYLIKYIVMVYSKESPYNKISDTLQTIQEKVCTDLGFPREIKELIYDFKMPELEECISMYINRETDEFVQQYMVARNIHALNMRLSSQSIDRYTGQLIDPKMQREYYDNAERFRDKMFDMKQEFTKSNYQFMQFVNDFRTKKNSNVGLNIEDIIPM